MTEQSSRVETRELAARVEVDGRNRIPQLERKEEREDEV
jgi:hypothetical protein